MQNVILYFDFEDVPTFQIYQQKYMSTSRIMDVVCNLEAVPFGVGKVHAKMILNGGAKDIQQFIEFIEETMGLCSEATQVEKT